MRRFLFTALIAAAPCAALAQTAAGVGVGTGVSSSSSGAAAYAGGAGIYAPNNSVSVSNTNVPKQVPSVFAPGLAAAAIETCLGSFSVGGSLPGGGLSFGTTKLDPSCNTRLNARALQALGRADAAMVLMCRSDEAIAEALRATGFQCPTADKPPPADPYFYDSKGNKFVAKQFKNERAARKAGATRSDTGEWVVLVTNNNQGR